MRVVRPAAAAAHERPLQRRRAAGARARAPARGRRAARSRRRRSQTRRSRAARPGTRPTCTWAAGTCRQGTARHGIACARARARQARQGLAGVRAPPDAKEHRRMAAAFLFDVPSRTGAADASASTRSRGRAPACALPACHAMPCCARPGRAGPGRAAWHSPRGAVSAADPVPHGAPQNRRPSHHRAFRIPSPTRSPGRPSLIRFRAPKSTAAIVHAALRCAALRCVPLRSVVLRSVVQRCIVLVRHRSAAHVSAVQTFHATVP